MRYRDLVQFEPISSVIQLREAGVEPEARRLVETYVISDRMADQIADVVIPQLQLDLPRDNKGVLIVGNYGTGKSHLMSLLSAVAEYPGMAAHLQNEKVRSAAGQIDGRFKVLRIEIGAVSSSLRDIVVRELEEALAEWGTPYTFPPANELTTNKDELIAAVAAVREAYPDHGLLLVIDELLDFLRTRRDQELILDLGFLRELGEVAALAPFRFMGGLQEALFDHPRFSFVAEPLRRVRDRFEQVIIGRQDISYVVSHRILRKNDEQIARVTEHLRPFTPLYGTMAERMDEFAKLFPIHPTYVDTFQNVIVAEKREVLRTFSQAVNALLDQEVPSDQPGLISFDHYWQTLLDNPSMRSYPEVAEVLEKGRILDQRVANGFTRKALTPMALRIIAGLGVHRLTTADINDPLGLTPEELRDGLCLYIRTPEATADFLLGQVQVALREIIRTVSGQYISHNEGNDQYYLDVKKDVDFDARIEERGATLSSDDLNGYFFDSLRQVLALDTSTYVSSHRIWAYELPWADRKVTRPGYLFFGAPDERSTAQPPRDFYVYLLPPFFERPLNDEQRADEVIFQLSGLDDTFSETLRHYAGARMLEAESPSHRTVYNAKAGDLRKRLIGWINSHLVTRLEVVYQGRRQPASAVLPRAASSASALIEDLLRIVAGTLLAPQFADRYPDYPAFTQLTHPITEANRSSAAREAIAQVAGRPRTNLGTAVIDALGLFGPDGDMAPGYSRYARSLLSRLTAKDGQQVVNRGEIIEVVAGGVDQPVEKEIAYRLEPEWVAVLLIALVHHGEITLTVSGRETLDASTVERAATMAVESIARFQHYGRPRQLPMQTWEAIFTGLGLQAALVKDEANRDQAVRELLPVVRRELDRVATLQAALAEGLKLWNESVFTDNFTMMSEGGSVVGIQAEGKLLTTTEIRAALREYKTFLEELQKFNTTGKLRNLQMTQSTVIDAINARSIVARGEELVRLVQQLQPIASYLAEAQANMPPQHEWAQAAETARRVLIDEVRSFGLGESGVRTRQSMLRDLDSLKQRYIAAYAALHRDAVLGPADDDRRRTIYDDPRLKALDILSKISLLTTSDLEGWKKAIGGMPTCREFHEGAIEASPTCPFCKFRPSQRVLTAPASATLATLEQRLTPTLENWRKSLKANLESDSAQSSLANMPNERGPVDAFLMQADNDPDIPAGFVKAATTALRGLSALPLTVEDLVDALKAGGLPCTVEEFKQRFNQFVQARMRGHDPNGTRLTLEQPVTDVLIQSVDSESVKA